ncbi:uncharacterized protein KQ657_003453 [Scheffersomyces spartinae]|uniref:Glutamine amidotransferase type-2 domain-containing protein n=1 Tax=Scheffersomyces spartinae TaxID=45513 RepID=A0A9P8AG91_9ASCO|nr:uncharacterized protein KQ657_003453 [Scheffersomyces spartinae]KAG7191409.1 hypothetical protein KQ657_003453 [Scheffersomyces spartinae]
MCGILCLVLEGGVSGLTPCVVTGLTEVYNQWIAGDESVVLTEAMRTKLDNLERIRTATQRLKTVRNDVKGKHRVEREMLEKEIAKLTLEGSESLSSSSPSSTPQPAAQAPLAGPIKQFKSLESSIAARGPDYVSRQVHGKYALFSSILSLRQPFTSQPMLTTNGFILQFNGELYNEECLESCDTSFIASMLAVIPSEARQQGVIDLLNRLKGEFAINIIDITEDIVYFGRDQIGKRSLLYRQEQDSLLIGSVAHDSSWTECQNRIYIYANGVIDSQPYDNYNSPLDMDVSLDIIEETLKKAVSIRTSTIHPQVATPSTLAVLFSGGLDCTVLAYLLGNELRCTNHQIDLLTVGFDNPRINQTASSSPDRLLARKSWANLSKIFAEDSVVFNLVEINVTYAEWLTHKERVTRLMAPNNTEMDLSIAIAFYFASNSRYPSVKTTLVGTEEHCVENYKSTAKVLFSGLGADELFAGYSRHEALFLDIAEDSEDNNVTEMYKALHASLVHDVDVIHKRNLGRDDRVIACWGKEVRYPYLDPDFISVAMAVNPRQKITYSFKTVVTKKCLEGKRVLVLERKHILRQLAGRLGLEWVKGELKRAIQFGAKSAKLEVGQSKTKGTDTL